MQIADAWRPCGMSCNKISLNVGVDRTHDHQRRIHGNSGTYFPEKRKNAGWRNVVWKGLYSNAFCGYADTVPVSGSSIMACERHDLCNDGSHACDTVPVCAGF